jgi:formylglycine-generating enzyme required for sulfatase activity
VSAWPSGDLQNVLLPAFRIDRFEATVGQYRACYERGACPWPATTASATRPDYLLDPAFADFPMINIDYDSAGRFCRFMGKRLPTAAEWEVAAAYAPASGRMYRFPWGDEFAPQLTNSAATGAADTMQVGSFRPAGDSPLGASDMAGNIAEWTSDVTAGDLPMNLIKGGSFVDQADSLRTNAADTHSPRASAAWLGVRCVADVH